MAEKKNTHRVHKLPEPFENVEVTVNPIRDYNAAEPFGLTVGVMDRTEGRGTRSSIEFAEAKAKTVLKAIRAYRRANPELIKQIEDRNRADRG